MSDRGLPSLSYERPTEGEIFVTRFSPGPPRLMRFDIIVMISGQAVLYPDQRPVNAPYNDNDCPYDINGALPGEICCVSWRDDQARFWVPWTPVTTICGDPG